MELAFLIFSRTPVVLCQKENVTLVLGSGDLCQEAQSKATFVFDTVRLQSMFRLQNRQIA